MTLRANSFSCGIYVHLVALRNTIHSPCTQKQYRDNPYHNRVHAADVLMTTHYLLKAKPLEVHTVYMNASVYGV